MSKMYYLVPLWGNCEKYLVKSLQILQNKAARAVTGQSWFTPIRRLLKDCKWLSVNQITFYQTALQTHKILVAQKPVFFIPRMNTLHPYRTRQAADGCIRRGEDISGKSFHSRGIKAYNSLPSSIRQSESIQTFKYKLRQWVSSNILIDKIRSPENEIQILISIASAVHFSCIVLS